MNHIRNMNDINNYIETNIDSLYEFTDFRIELLTKKQIIKILNQNDNLILHILRNTKDLDAYIDYEQRLIHIAVEKDKDKVVAYLIYHGADVKTPCKVKNRRWTPLEYGANNYAKKSVKLLLKPDIINKEDEYKKFINYYSNLKKNKYNNLFCFFEK